jgi:hypothetical protein
MRLVQQLSDPVHELWVRHYGAALAAQLEPDRRYTLIKVGDAQFAYTDQRQYLRALGRAWDAGFVPQPLPSALGRELVSVAPRLSGVDADPTGVGPQPARPRGLRLA